MKNKENKIEKEKKHRCIIKDEKKKKPFIICSIIAVLIIAGSVFSYMYYNGLYNYAWRYVQPKDNQIRVACVGDSVTFGMNMKKWYENAYPFQLREMVSDDYCIENFGYSGRTVMKSCDRPYVRYKLYKKSKNYLPDIVIFQMGSNDSKSYNWTNKEDFKNEYRELLESYISLPSHPRVIVCTPPPAFEHNGRVIFKINADVIENEIAPAVREIAEEYNLEIIDLIEMFYDHSELFRDGLHPVKEGAAMIAEEVYKRITE